jgi:hypothetical protein
MVKSSNSNCKELIEPRESLENTHVENDAFKLKQFFEGEKSMSKDKAKGLLVLLICPVRALYTIGLLLPAFKTIRFWLAIIPAPIGVRHF